MNKNCVNWNNFLLLLLNFQCRDLLRKLLFQFRVQQIFVHLQSQLRYDNRIAKSIFFIFYNCKKKIFDNNIVIDIADTI